MKKVYFFLFTFCIILSSCTEGGGAGGNNLVVTASDSVRFISSQNSSRVATPVASDGVDELLIYHSVIYAYNYDFGSGHWNTETITNPDGSVQPKDQYQHSVMEQHFLSFKRGEEHQFPFTKDLPNTIDIIYFYNDIEMIGVNGELYGPDDLSNMTSAQLYEQSGYNEVKVRTSYLDIDDDSIGNTSDNTEWFRSIHVAFVNKDIISRSFVSDSYMHYAYSDYESYKLDAESSSRPYVSEDEYDNYDGYKLGADIELRPYMSENEYNVAFEIYQEVSMFNKLVVIPFDGVSDLGDKDIVITLTLDNMIDNISDTQIVWNDLSGLGAAINYQVSFR